MFVFELASFRVEDAIGLLEQLRTLSSVSLKTRFVLLNTLLDTKVSSRCYVWWLFFLSIRTQAAWRTLSDNDVRPVGAFVLASPPRPLRGSAIPAF